MEPSKGQFYNVNGNRRVVTTSVQEKNKPHYKLVGEGIDRDVADLLAEQEANPTSGLRGRKTKASDLMGNQEKLLENLGKDVRRTARAEGASNKSENTRELRTAEAFRTNPTIAELMKREEPLEVSGDALARVRRGDAPKLIATTATWDKRKKDLGVGE
jgi:hypothetical protein